MSEYTFKVMPQSWYKRRKPTSPELTINSVNVSGFQKVDNAYCKLVVTMSDSVSYELDARINVNDISQRWTVHGTNPHGLSVLLELVEKN
jgi:hypothetical protein